MKNRTDQPIEQSDQSSQKHTPNWRRRLLVMALLLAVLVFFLPMIVASTPLRHTAISWATAELNGELQVDQISLGWFSPIQLSEVTLIDTEGEIVATVQSVRSAKTLTQLVNATSDYGHFEIETPNIVIQVDSNETNLERILSKYLAPTPQPTHQTVPTNPQDSLLPKLSATITNGSVSIQLPNQTQTRITALSSEVQVSGAKAPLTATVKFDVSTHDGKNGHIEVLAHIDANQDRLTGSTIQANISSNQFPVAALTPILERIVGPIALDGQIDGQIGLVADTRRSTLVSEIKVLDLQHISIQYPQLLGSDTFVAERLTGQGKLNLTTQDVSAEQFVVKTDCAKISLDGQFDLSQLTNFASTGSLPSSRFELNGQIDLSQIIHMLPETFGLRDGVVVKSGFVSVQANTRDENGVQRLVFNLDAANINAHNNGQAIVWQRPLRIVGTASEKDNQIVLERLTCDSEFFNVVGSASLASGDFTLEGNLSRLMEQAGKILDLSGFEIAGQLNGRLNWRQQTDTLDAMKTSAPIKMGGQLVIDNPIIGLPGFERWSQKQLRIDLESLGRASINGPIAIESGRLEVQMGQERAVATLAEPIPNIQSIEMVQANCTVEGEIYHWLTHIQNFVELPQMASAGNLTSQFSVAYTPKHITLANAKFEIDNFGFDGFGLRVREQQLVGSGGPLSIQTSDGTMMLANGSFAGPSLAANLENFGLKVGNTIRADGLIAYRTDLNKSSQWLDFNRPGDSIVWTGLSDGHINFSSINNVLGGTISANMQDVAFYQKESVQNEHPTSTNERSTTQQASAKTTYGEFWREPTAKLITRFVISDDFDTVRVAGLQLDSKMAQVRGRGTFSDFSGEINTDLVGKWKLDWAGVNQLVNQMAANVIEVQGDSWQPFEVQGPLLSNLSTNVPYAWINPNLSVKTAVQWRTAAILRLPFESSLINVDLNRAIAQFTSPSTGGIGSIMSLKPTLDLQHASPMLTLDQGILFRDLDLSAKHTQDWLQYVAPMVADATRAKGHVTCATTGAHVPVFDPINSNARGSVILQNVAIGPGPMTEQLIPVIDQLLKLTKSESTSLGNRNMWLQLPQQEIPFAVQDGRVYHQGLEFRYKNIPIRTKGNVGFNQTMNIVATIPIMDNWIAREPLLAGLKGQSISIPITGTLSQPRLDKRAVRDLTRQLLNQAASTAINDAVGDKINGFQSDLKSKFGKELDKLKGALDGKKGETKLIDGLNRLFNKKDK